MAPSDERAAEALGELESIHFLHLYADRKLIDQQAYVAAARQLERRGRLTQWSLVIGACCWAGRAGAMERGRPPCSDLDHRPLKLSIQRQGAARS